MSGRLKILKANNKPSWQQLPVGFCISRDILEETLSARASGQ
jgi:hypothetical protein